MSLFFIKKIWENKPDEQVHQQFVRFSKGIYENRAVINISRNGKCKLSGTFELANDLVRFAFSLAGSMEVSGTMFSREDVSVLLKSFGISAEVKKKSLIYKAEISGRLDSAQVEKLAEKAYSMLFSCTGEGVTLKMKSKLPKPGKSAAKVDDKFCVLEADIKFFDKLKEEFAFSIAENFKKARISHTYEIKDIILPENEKNPELIRLKAKRKGKITRTIEFDGKILKQEKDFEA